MNSLRRNITLLVTLGLLFCGTKTAVAQVSREYLIKASVVVLLGKFVTWPRQDAPNRNNPLVIGILGQDPFFENGANQLDLRVASENSKGGNLVVKRFDSAADYQDCHMLFVSATAAANSDEQTIQARLTAAKKITQGKSVMLVGESQRMANDGCVANLMFTPSTNVIVLEINPKAAQVAQLQPSPDLLGLSIVKIVQ